MALTLFTTPMSSIAPTTASSGGNTIAGTVTGSITAKGVCWNTTVNPIASGSHTHNGTGSADFTSNLTSLAAGQTYYVRAYVIDGSGTYYGANVIFTTPGLLTVDPDAATPAITSTTATSGAISVYGFTSVTAVGVCWNTSTSPTISNNHTTDILMGTIFNSFITGLLPGTLYYVRAYVTSGGVTYYSSLTQTFTTLVVIPTVITTTIASITLSGAIVSGNVTATGGNAISARGINYSLSSSMSSPTSVSSGTTGLGAFSSTLSGLTVGTTYYVQAYATNSAGTAYGAILNFTTLGGPTVETVIPYSITSSTANSGCDVVSTGGSAVTGRGVVISTTSGVTLATGTSFADSNYGNGTQFLVKLTGLTRDTTYYIKAYAVNAQGTAYGEELIFSTLACNPYTDDCGPYEEPPVECDVTECEYYIPDGCTVYNGGNILCTDTFYGDPSVTKIINNISIYGTIDAGILTVNAIEYGTLIVGTVISAVGVTDGTYIVNQLTGTTGGLGTYTLNNLQTVTYKKFISEKYTSDVILENINTALCSSFSKQHIKDMLLAIKNDQSLSVQFCTISCSCATRCAGT